MDARHPPDGFTQTFLLDGEPDLSTLKIISGSEVEARKKRAHRKSRWGCIACKRRKVKVSSDPCPWRRHLLVSAILTAMHVYRCSRSVVLDVKTNHG